MNTTKTIFFGIAAAFLFTVITCTKGPAGTGPDIESGTVTDYDGNVYATVKIGNQVWTAENLRVTKYNDGTPIPYIADNMVWDTLSTPGYCYYTNTTNIDSIKKFGAFYNWYTINANSFAPKGWHVPSDSEWDILQNYLISNGYNYDGTTMGNKIAKSLAAKTDWEPSSDSGAIGNDLTSNNKSNFSALPSGYRYRDGAFTDIGTYGLWWTSTYGGDWVGAGYRCLGYNVYQLYGTYEYCESGFSVRLVKD